MGKVFCNEREANEFVEVLGSKLRILSMALGDLQDGHGEPKEKATDLRDYTQELINYVDTYHVPRL